MLVLLGVPFALVGFGARRASLLLAHMTMVVAGILGGIPWAKAIDLI